MIGLVAEPIDAVRKISRNNGEGCNELFTAIFKLAVLRISWRIQQDDEDVEA